MARGGRRRILHVVIGGGLGVGFQDSRHLRAVRPHGGWHGSCAHGGVLHGGVRHVHLLHGGR